MEKFIPRARTPVPARPGVREGHFARGRLRRCSGETRSGASGADRARRCLRHRCCSVPQLADFLCHGAAGHPAHPVGRRVPTTAVGAPTAPRGRFVQASGELRRIASSEASRPTTPATSKESPARSAARRCRGLSARERRGPGTAAATVVDSSCAHRAQNPSGNADSMPLAGSTERCGQAGHSGAALQSGYQQLVASKSWEGIPWWRRLAYYARYALAVLGALLTGPGMAGTAISPMDPRRLRDAPPGPDSIDEKKQPGSGGSAV